jgi:tRNA threonylcarbamoyl adenosine modification protein YeaZ
MFLCIDTVTENSGVAVVPEKGAVFFERLEPGRSSEGILQAVDKGLRSAGATLSDLLAVFVVRGPGSFTGLRVGLSVADTFAHQLKIPIVGLKTDELARFRSDERPVTYLQSMNRDEVYAAELGGDTDAGAGAIIPLPDLLSRPAFRWFGPLSEVHQKAVSGAHQEVTVLIDPAESWGKAARSLGIDLPEHALYDLPEPFYGKGPAITERKKQ